MRLGLVASILEHMNFEEMIDFASANQLDCVELHVGQVVRENVGTPG